MNAKEFLINLSQTKECKDIEYKCFSIQKPMGLYNSKKKKINQIDPFMIPFGMRIKNELQISCIDVNELISYMDKNDKLGYSSFALSTWFDLDAETIDIDVFSLIVENYILDNICSHSLDINNIVSGEIFLYPTNQYGLTNVNGAEFKQDGLLFDGKGYYYNIFTNKKLISPTDSIPGFVKIIQSYSKPFDLLYRLDERLSLPEPEYHDYSGFVHAKFYGPNLNLTNINFQNNKEIIVHMDPETGDKLLMVIKRDYDKITSEKFFHIEIETLPCLTSETNHIITTFLHAMYYPQRSVFTHIDYTKNQYSYKEYLHKYQDSKNGIPIDHYTASKKLHYKIWCIENGEFSKDMWYKLMAISLKDNYKKLLDEILQ